MFCDKCGREIRHDSEYCSYCGAPIGSTEAITSGSAKGGAAKSASDASCVVPRAPKKHCLDCQKELPASSISDICALCTIRRRNRELEKDRVDSDAAYAKLDRYDISDEFDQTVFQGNKYYKSNPDSEPLYRQRTEAPHVSPFKRREQEDDRKVARKGLGFSWLAVVVIIALLGIFGSVAEFNPPKTPEGEATVSVVASEVVEVPAESSGWEALPVASLSADGSLPQTTDAGFVPQSYEDIMLRVSEVTLYELGNALTNNGETPLNLAVEDGLFSYENGYLFSKGKAVYMDEGDPAESFTTFEMCMMMTRTQYIVVSVSLADSVKFDLSSMIDSDGMLTEEGAEEISTESAPAYPGDTVLSDPVIFPGEFGQ